MYCRLLLAFLCLGTGLWAQKPEEVRGTESRRKEVKGEKDAEGENAKITQEEWERLTPEERLARSVTHGAARYCRFTAAARPAKLMPGQSGVILISAILQGQAVLPSPAPLEFVGQAQQGMVSLGSLAVRPALAGTLASAYLGQSVYDNTAVLEIPVTMSAQAEMGKKQGVAIDMRFDLYDGNSAQAIGRFIDRASLEIEVGQALDPAVVGGMPKAKGETADAQPIGSTPRGSSSSLATPREPALPESHAVAPNDPPRKPPEPVPAVSESPTPTSPPAPQEEGLPVLLIAGGGVLLLLMVLVLARKK